jgi:hypothetical protein
MKTKITMMLTGALILGILIGVLATGHYTRQKVVRIKEMGTPDGMHKRFQQLLDADEEQYEQLKPYLDEFAERSQQMRKRHWTERTALFTEMQEKMQPLLTDEQYDRLESLKNRPSHRGGRNQEEQHMRKHKYRERQQDDR